MTCNQAQERIMEPGGSDGTAAEHLASCENCREFLALQRSIDGQLHAAYRAPALPAGFRMEVRKKVKHEKRKRTWEIVRSLMAPCTALATSGVCALAIPELAQAILATGMALGAAGYLGQLLFVWLTEELGEG